MILGLLALVGWFARAPLFDNLLAPILPKPFHVARDCWFHWEANRQIDCGYLYVYEDRDLKSGMVRLPVVVAKSTVPDRREDPVLMINGGPGGVAFGPLQVIGELLSGELEGLPWARNRDVIFYDQRGAGWSWPSLKCPEYWRARARLWDAAEMEAGIIACRDRLLAEGIDLTAYNTSASADDIEDLRQSLNIDRWNLRGVSYGTRLALTAMRRYPEGVRSAILIGVLVSVPESERRAGGANKVVALGLLKIIVEILEACARFPECETEYPDIRDIFFYTLRALHDRPVELDVPAELNVGMPFDRAHRKFKIDDAIYLHLLVSSLKKGNLEEILPLIDDFAKRWYGRWVNLIEAIDPRFESLLFTKGMFWSVRCNDTPVSDWKEPLSEKVMASEFRGYHQWRSRTSPCMYWPHRSSRRLDTSPVESGIPTLLLTGALDRVTPPSLAKRAARSLSNGYLFELPGRGHNVGDDLCANTLISAFLDDPSKRPVAACLEALSNAN